jgi:hypothetical protein
MMEPFHGEQFPLDSIMCLIQERTGHRHLWVFKDRVPAGLLVLKPAPHSRAIGCPHRAGDVIGKVTQPLAERKHAQALALARPVQEGVELCA